MSVRELRDGAAAWRIFLFLATVYLATYGGHLYTGDGIEMERTAESLILRGDLAVEPGVDGHVWGYPGADGRRYSPYALGLSVVEAPFIGVAHLIGRTLGLAEMPDRKVLWTLVTSVNVLVTAAAGALLFLFLRGVGEGKRSSAGTALIYGLGTMAWVYSKHDFAEPLAGLALLGAAHFLLRAGRNGDDRSLLLAGAFNGFGFFTKYQMVILTPALLFVILRDPRYRSGGGAALARRVALFLVAGLPFGLANLAVNHARFGMWLQTGYANQGEIVAGWGHVAEGLFGLFLSPGKGLFWYSPILILSLFSWREYRRRHREAALLGESLIALTVLTFAPLWWWHGDWSWGPRYLVVVLPFLAAPLCAWSGEGGGRKRFTIVLLVAALAVNGLGLSINFNYYLAELKTMEMSHDDWNFIPGLSPIRFHAHVALSNGMGLIGMARPDFVYRAWSDGAFRRRAIPMEGYPAAGSEADFFFFRPRSSSAERLGLAFIGLLLLGAAALQGREIRRRLLAGAR